MALNVWTCFTGIDFLLYLDWENGLLCDVHFIKLLLKLIFFSAVAAFKAARNPQDEVGKNIIC